MTKRGTGAFSHASAPRLRALLLVFAGGMIGTAARWSVSSLLPQGQLGEASYSWGTLAVDLAGSLLLGWLLAALARRSPDPAAEVTWRLLLGTGFCGAFTTFSSVALESARFAHDGRVGAAVGWLAVTVVGGIGCAALGAFVGSRHHDRRPA